VVTVAGLASKEEGKDALDLAVIEYAKTVGVNLNRYRQISFTPFDPSIKRSEAVVVAAGKSFRAVKGAPQIVISICREIDEDTRQRASKLVEELSMKGSRILAVARSKDEDLDNLQIVGLLSLADPPNPDSRSMIEEAKNSE